MWEVLIDKILQKKRFVRIRDITNKREYENFFPKNTADAAVTARFKLQVKEHRAELDAQGSSINLSNFEAGL